MPQLHLYVPESLAVKIRQKASERGLSVSRYLAEVVQRDVGRDWPAGYFDEVIGGWRGEPLVRPLQDDYELRDEL